MNNQLLHTMYILNKNELRVFKSVCDGHVSAAALIEDTGLSNISIYRIIQSLSSKKLVTSRRDGKINIIFISSHGHSKALATYLEGNSRAIEPLIGSRLLAMLSASSNQKTLGRIATETRLAPESVRRIVWALKGFAAVAQDGDVISIPQSDKILTRFLQDFSRGACAAVLDDITSAGRILWCEGLQFIFASRELKDTSGIRSTGVTAMSQRGLQFISDTKYYHYAYWRPSLKPEDIALHNILIDPSSSRGIAYSLLFLFKSGYRSGYLRRQGDAMGVGELSELMIKYLDGENVENLLFPSRSDMQELRIQYGVK